MAKLVILDVSCGAVISFNVGSQAKDKLENVYDNDVERWFSEEGYEKEFNINLSDCDYLFVEDALFEKHNI